MEISSLLSGSLLLFVTAAALHSSHWTRPHSVVIILRVSSTPTSYELKNHLVLWACQALENTILQLEEGLGYRFRGGEE
jgi:hypothetical protein